MLAARATLRMTEQTVLLNAATAYMNLLRDSAILDLQKRNVEVLQEQLRQTRDRFNVGEVTRTDVAQSESRLAAGRSQVLTAQANYNASMATYRQVIGTDPGKLTPGTPVDRFSPHELPGAIAAGTANHPAVTTAQYNVDVALLQVKVAEGALYPTVSVQGSFTQELAERRQPQYHEELQRLGARHAQRADLSGRRGIFRDPPGQGDARAEAPRPRCRARHGAPERGASPGASSRRPRPISTPRTAQVQAAEIALNGVREEARVGQRTTLDVLNAQQELVNARVALVTAQRDRVVASYTLLAAVGRLSPEVLGLQVPVYDATVHYQQVRDSWAGVRTPDGR